MRVYFKTDGRDIFSIPPSVNRSVTADIVKTGTSVVDSQFMQYGALRGAAMEARFRWFEALRALEHVEKMSSVGGDILTSSIKAAERCAANYKAELMRMAANGIWNCEEFANFALIIIHEKKILKSEYTAHYAALNDLKKYEGFPNHDHIFIVIKEKGRDEPLFVIDLWQRFVTGVPFIGEVDSFIATLRSDGRYVLEGVKKEHITTITRDDLLRVSGEAVKVEVGERITVAAGGAGAGATVGIGPRSAATKAGSRIWAPPSAATGVGADRRVEDETVDLSQPAGGSVASGRGCCA